MEAPILTGQDLLAPGSVMTLESCHPTPFAALDGGSTFGLRRGGA